MPLKRILHIEDDQDIQEITLFVLQNLGKFICEQRSSGDEAVEKAHLFIPDLLILDVMMPGMNGPETLTKLREIQEYKSIPAIFMTAKAQPGEVQTLMELGALDVFTKPFDPMTLVDRINQSWHTLVKQIV